MEKLSRNATDEGARSYDDRIRRTLIRRLRRHLPYLREGFKKFKLSDKHQFIIFHFHSLSILNFPFWGMKRGIYGI